MKPTKPSIAKSNSIHRVDLIIDNCINTDSDRVPGEELIREYPGQFSTHLVRISWGGTSKAPVRRSTHLKIMMKEMMVISMMISMMMMRVHLYASIQGRTKKSPGPFAPPLLSLFMLIFMLISTLVTYPL